MLEIILPRLSLWKETHSNDYKFFDRRISEMFTVGGTGILLHKYLGPKDQASNDATKPSYINQSEQNIQDLLFLENRDRKYDSTVYKLRGIYQVSDSDFDLSQFGLFLQTGTLFMTFHIKYMVSLIGRRIMNGDVLELMHLTDYDALNDVPLALKRFFVVSDCSRASEGFSPTWWPHLWRCKINPLVDSQEYKDILSKVQVSSTGQSDSLGNLLSTYGKYSTINDAIIAQAEIDVPKSGYDTSSLFVQPIDPVTGKETASLAPTADNASVDGLDASGGSNLTADRQLITPDRKIKGYLTGDGLPPNSLPVTTGISFPSEPSIGDYCLRTDYMPNRLFRYDGRCWIKVEDAVRTNLTPGAVDNQTLKSGFINNNSTYNDQYGTHEQRTSLSKAFKPQSDN